MATVNYVEALDEAIRKMENQRDEDRKILRAQFQVAYESVKPGNLVRSAIKEITESTDLRDNLLNYAIGAGTGYLAKKAVVRSSHNPFKNLLGNVLQMGVTNVVSKKSDLIKTVGSALLKALFRKKNKKQENEEQETEEEQFNEALYSDYSDTFPERSPAK